MVRRESQKFDVIRSLDVILANRDDHEIELEKQQNPH